MTLRLFPGKFDTKTLSLEKSGFISLSFDPTFRGLNKKCPIFDQKVNFF